MPGLLNIEANQQYIAYIIVDLPKASNGTTEIWNKVGVGIVCKIEATHNFSG